MIGVQSSSLSSLSCVFHAGFESLVGVPCFTAFSPSYVSASLFVTLPPDMLGVRWSQHRGDDMRRSAADHADAQLHAPDDSRRKTDTSTYPGADLHHQAPRSPWRRQGRSWKVYSLASAALRGILSSQGTVSSPGPWGTRYAQGSAPDSEGLHRRTSGILPPPSRIDGRGVSHVANTRAPFILIYVGFPHAPGCF